LDFFDESGAAHECLSAAILISEEAEEVDKYNLVD